MRLVATHAHTIVLVDAIWVPSVVNTMVGWSVKHPLQWTKVTDHFSVNPELVKQVELLVCDIGCGRDQQSQWEVEELKHRCQPKYNLHQNTHPQLTQEVNRCMADCLRAVDNV